METAVILVRVARLYFTETWESFTSTRRSSVQPSCAICPRQAWRNGAEDEQLTAIQHIPRPNGKNVFVVPRSQAVLGGRNLPKRPGNEARLLTARSKFLWGLNLPGLYRASRPFRKGRSGISPSTSTDFKTMSSHDAGVVNFTEYLSVLFQLTYVDELYRM